MAPKRLTAVKKDQPFHNLGGCARADHGRSQAKVKALRSLREPSMKRANSQIQHVVRLIVKKSTYSREQNLNQNESVIRRRFVPDSFQLLISNHFGA